MKRTLIEIYALVVCFFSVACLVIVMGISLWDVVQIFSPKFTIDSRTYQTHLNNESYKRRHCFDCKAKLDQEKTLDEQELTLARDKSWKENLEIEKRSAAQSLVRNIIIIFLDILLFSIHWYLIKKSGEESS